MKKVNIAFLAIGIANLMIAFIVKNWVFAFSGLAVASLAFVDLDREK
ncbi:hypothetical protein [Streptococcus oricebi]|nr:hypothetical protein [Streptococcus oricebi]